MLQKMRTQPNQHVNVTSYWDIGRSYSGCEILRQLVGGKHPNDSQGFSMFQSTVCVTRLYWTLFHNPE